jgi:hypothetical protein
MRSQSRPAGRNKKAQRPSTSLRAGFQRWEGEGKESECLGHGIGSSEDVSVIVSDLGFLQDRYQLDLKAARRMMARLIPDVRGHRPFMCRADAESRVPFLPGKTAVIPVEPSRAIALQVLQRFGQGQGRGQGDQKMHVGGGASGNDERNMFLSRDAAEVTS